MSPAGDPFLVIPWDDDPPPSMRKFFFFVNFFANLKPFLKVSRKHKTYKLLILDVEFNFYVVFTISEKPDLHISVGRKDGIWKQFNMYEFFLAIANPTFLQKEVQMFIAFSRLLQE